MSDQRSLIPDPVDRFLARYVNSIEYLEILLYLAERAERGFTVDELSRAMYTAPASVQRRLEKMVSDGLVSMTTGPGQLYAFAPSSSEMLPLVAEVSAVYRERRVAVVTRIASRPMDNVRAFSDAFRLGKKEKP